MRSVLHILLAASVLLLAQPTRAAAALPPTPATQYLDLPDGRIAYDDTGGTGPLVVAVPGMGDLRGEYRLLRPALAQAGYRVVTLDVRGHGQTSAVWPEYSARAVGRDVQALIARLGAGRAVIIGTSFAAGAALWTAHDAPASVRGVVLIGPVLRDRPQSWATRFMLRAGFAGPWRVALWISYWNSLFPLHKPDDHTAYEAALRANLHEPGRMDALRAMLFLSKADTTAILPTTHIPALVVMGTADPDFDDATQEAAFVAGQLHAQTMLVPGAGHYPQVEAPDQVAPRIINFLRVLP